MPSHVKAVLDRTVPLVQMRMTKEDGGRIRHETLSDFSHIHTVVISGCGFPNWEGNFDPLRIMCQNSFRDPTIVCVPEAPLFNIPEATIVAEPRLRQFEEAGAEYARSLNLLPNTIAQLESPMIPAEAYLRGVNEAE